MSESEVERKGHKKERKRKMRREKGIITKIWEKKEERHE